MLNIPKKKRTKKLPKISYTTLVDTFPRSMHFQTRCRLKFFLPYGPMLTKTKKKKKKWQNSKIWNIANLYTTLVETLPRSMHDFFAVSLFCNFRGDVIWNFSPMWSHVKENERNRKESKMQNFEKQKKKNGLEIGWKGTFPPNSALICLTGSEKTGFTDDGRTDDGQRTPTWQNFKSPKRRFVRTIGRKIQDKFQNFWLRFVGGVVFWNFHSHCVPC